MIHLNKILLYGVIFTALLGSTGCKTTFVQHFADYSANSEVLNESSKSNAEIEAMIAPYKAEMDAEMNIEVGHLDQDINKARPNSSMGNWFCDMLLDASDTLDLFPNLEIDFAVQNLGGLRLNNMAAGPLTKGKIFELMPFDNTLVALQLNPSKVQMLLNRIAEYGGWPISKNLAFTIKDSVATDIMIHGKPLPAKKMYTVLLPDYVANGGDDCHFLADIPQKNCDKFIRDIIIEYYEKLTAAGNNANIDNAKRINISK